MKDFLGKDFWKGLGVIFALIFSILSYYQSNKTKKDTMRKLEIENLKRRASEWFVRCEYKKSFELYQNVFSLDPNDDEGYMNFLNEGKTQLARRNGKCDEIVKEEFFERAKKITKDVVEIDKLLEQCKQH